MNTRSPTIRPVDTWRVLEPCLFALLLCPPPAHARVERFAVIIGNNTGHKSETPLRYAESDADRMHNVLRDLGKFEPYNMVLLQDDTAATVRSALLSVNERIRGAVSSPETKALLFVYSSGHADPQALHLGKSTLPLRDLAQWVRGSAATFRLLVVDACKSGNLTRVKGGRVVDPFDIPEETLPADGLAFLTASAATEDAQESDRLKGSFFTHALVSGLLGAADQDEDGTVDLDEAYRYAYDATLKSTSRTWAGTQHPGFRYDIRGSGDLVLTWPGVRSESRAQFRFPRDIGFLMMRGDSDGPVVAELSARSSQRRLSLRAGRYFARARGTDVLYEGTIDAVARSSSLVNLSELQRVEYAHLARKGRRDDRMTHGPEAGARIRSALPSEQTSCIGAFVGYSLDTEHLSARLRLSACRGSFHSKYVTASTYAYDVELHGYKVWDAGALSWQLGLGAGYSLLSQHFKTRGVAPSRHSSAPFLSVQLGSTLSIGYGFGLQFDVSAETHFLNIQTLPESNAPISIAFAVRPGLSAQKRF